MACDKSKGDCRPCLDCQDVVPQVMPRCNNALPDGVFRNATVSIDGGCIVKVTEGEPLLYQPDPCCQSTGGAVSASTGAGLKGDKGDPGQNATVAVGTVYTVAHDQPAKVVNIGTSTHAILNFQIPKGASGADGNVDSGDDFNHSGLVIENGVVKEVPLGWLVLTELKGDEADTNFKFETSLDDKTGIMTLRVNASGFYDKTMTALGAELAKRDNQLLVLQTQVAALEAAVIKLQQATTV